MIKFQGVKTGENGDTRILFYPRPQALGTTPNDHSQPRQENGTMRVETEPQSLQNGITVRETVTSPAMD